MATTVYWLNGGGCGGDSLSLLNVEFPNFINLLHSHDIELLWHPSLSDTTPLKHDELLEKIQADTQPLDLLIVEGLIICGPAGTGMYWKPSLHVEVAPGGAKRFEQLKHLLHGSGIEVRQRAR